MEWAEPKCLLSLSWDIHWGGPWISGSHYIRFLCIAWRVASVCILHKFRLPTALLFMSAVLQPCKNIYLLCIWHQEFSSVQFSSSVVSDSLQPHELQHARPPCPSPTHRVYPNLCPLSRWCHPIISAAVLPFSSCLQSFPASGSFQMTQLFASGGQSIGISASTSVLLTNIQGWFPLGWTFFYLLAVQGTLKSLLQHHCSSKVSTLWHCSPFQNRCPLV